MAGRDATTQPSGCFSSLTKRINNDIEQRNKLTFAVVTTAHSPRAELGDRRKSSETIPAELSGESHLWMTFPPGSWTQQGEAAVQYIVRITLFVFVQGIIDPR